MIYLFHFIHFAAIFVKEYGPEKKMFLWMVLRQDLLKDGKIEQEIIMPVIDGRDIERYFFDRVSGKYILYPYRIDNDELKLIDIEEFPKAKAYLEKHRYDLEQRRNWGQTILEAGKKYYEIWNPSPYLQKKKILTQDISEKNKFALDDIGGYLAMNTCYALLLRDELAEDPKSPSPPPRPSAPA